MKYIFLPISSQEKPLPCSHRDSGESNSWQNHHLRSQQQCRDQHGVGLCVSRSFRPWPWLRLFLHRASSEWACGSDHLLHCSRAGPAGGVCGLHEASAPVPLPPCAALSPTPAPGGSHQSHERGRTARNNATTLAQGIWAQCCAHGKHSENVCQSPAITQYPVTGDIIRAACVHVLGAGVRRSDKCYWCKALW